MSALLALQFGCAALQIAALKVQAPPTGTIRGVVLDAETHQPLADAVVVASSSSIVDEETAVTDDSGAFELIPLPAGVYALDFQQEGYLLFSRANVQVTANRSVALEAQLIRGPDWKPPMARVVAPAADKNAPSEGPLSCHFSSEDAPPVYTYSSCDPRRDLCKYFSEWQVRIDR